MNSQNREFNLLKENKLFQGLNEAQLAEIFSLSHVLKIKPDEFLIQEDAFADKFYIIEEGTVEILKKDRNNNLYRIGTLGPGDIVGEIGLISNKKRTASIRVLTPLVAIAFSIPELQAKEKDEILLLLNRNISEILINRLDFAYNVTVESMRNLLKKSKKIILYQVIVSVIMLFLIFELGMVVYYIFHSSDLCDLRNKALEIPSSNIF